MKIGVRGCQLSAWCIANPFFQRLISKFASVKFFNIFLHFCAILLKPVWVAPPRTAHAVSATLPTVVGDKDWRLGTPIEMNEKVANIFVSTMMYPMIDQPLILSQTVIVDSVRLKPLMIFHFD